MAFATFASTAFAATMRDASTETVDPAHIERVHAARHAKPLHDAQSSHDLYHASADRTLKSLRYGGAQVVSPLGVVHRGDGIQLEDVRLHAKCSCCAQYKASAHPVRKGHAHAPQAATEGASAAVRLRAQVTALLA